MSVHGRDGDDADKKPSERTAEDAAGFGAAQPGGGYESAERSARQLRGGGLMDINRRLHRRVGRSTAGEAVSRHAQLFRSLLSELLGKDNPFEVLILDNQEHQVALSAIVLALPAEEGGKKMVAAHSMIVESSGPALAPRPFNIGGQQVEIPTTAGDTADEWFWNQVEALIHEKIGPDADMRDAGTTVIHKELDPEDKARHHNLLHNATTALTTTLDNALGGDLEPKFSINWIEPQDILTARIDYNPVPLESCDGLPKRSDLAILLNVRQQQAQQQVHASSMELSRVDGFMDLVYSPPQQHHQVPMYGQPPMTQFFYPRFVLTHAEPETNAITPELYLLTLQTATLAQESMAWAGVFRPRHGAGLNLRNIGALGLEMPELVGGKPGEGKIIDTQASDFKREHLYELITYAVHNEVVYTIHVEESGDLSWLQLAFLAAANGNAGASEVIVQAADNLTGGAFRQIWKGGQICMDEQTRIPLGYYEDESTGEMRDLREIDYLALLNLVGEKDMGLVIEWCETLEAFGTPMEIRLEKQLRILNTVIGEGRYRITGYARPVTFTPDFIQALNQACAMAGLVVQPERIMQDMTGGYQRGNRRIAEQAVGAPGGGVFQFNTGPTQYRAGMPHMGRWGGRGRW